MAKRLQTDYIDTYQRQGRQHAKLNTDKASSHFHTVSNIIHRNSLPCLTRFHTLKTKILRHILKQGKSLFEHGKLEIRRQPLPNPHPALANDYGKTKS